MARKLKRDFYLRSAEDCVRDFLGKYLVHDTPKGRISGLIVDVEAYPAYKDDVSHGNKRTERTEIMYGEGGYAYIYLVYGIHHQFAVVVNYKDIPEVVFIRGVLPVEGIDLMKENYNKEISNDRELTNSPGKLCKSFNITKDLYGADLLGNILFLEDRSYKIDLSKVKSGKRVGINKKLEGSESNLRFYLDVNGV